MDWYWNLVSLLLDENRIDKSATGLRHQMESNIINLYQKLLLYQARSVCLYHRNPVASVMRDLLKMDDWAGQLNEIQGAEALVQRNAEQFNSEQVKTHLGNIALGARLQQTKLDSIHSAIQHQTERQEKRAQHDKDEQCMRDLRVTDPREDKRRIQEKKGGLLRDSYYWILGHEGFRQFRDDPHNRLLWIKGAPGKGKTMLMCGIIDELQKELNSNLSFFFCQQIEPELNTATSVLRGLIFLLLLQRPSLIPIMRSKYDFAGGKLFQGINVWVSLTDIFLNMLRDPVSNDAILVVDALDECTSSRGQLLDFILQSYATSPPGVKWIITSRSWPDIEEKLNSAKKISLQLELNHLHVSAAVNTYIEYKVGKLAVEKKYDPEMKHTVTRHLVENANNTFLWVALVCQELSKVRRMGQTIARLASLPPDLDALYGRMMAEISESEDADICKQILAVISVVYRPISLLELQALTPSLEGFTLDDLKDIVGSCGSFLTLKEDVIYLVHQSAKDYLLSKEAADMFPSGVEHQHRTIFSSSMKALSGTLHRDIYGLHEPAFPVDQILVPTPNPLAAIQYSCVYWIDHALASGLKQRMAEDTNLAEGCEIDDFIRSRFLFWLESLGILHALDEAVMAIERLEASLVRHRVLRCMREKRLTYG